MPGFWPTVQWRLNKDLSRAGLARCRTHEGPERITQPHHSPPRACRPGPARARRRAACTRTPAPASCAKRLDLSAPLLSHHLKVLREAGLVSCAKVGRRVEVTLDREALARARRIGRPHERDRRSARASRRSGTRSGCSPAATLAWFALYHALLPFWNWLLYGVLALPRGPHWADALHFFLYDTTKILLLLVGIIFAVRSCAASSRSSAPARCSAASARGSATSPPPGSALRRRSAPAALSRPSSASSPPGCRSA